MANGLVIRPFVETDSAINNYCLHPEHALFTSLPITVVDTFKKDEFNQPFVIYFNEHLIGFFALYTNKTGNIYTGNENSILFKSFSIDSRFQNKGHALTTLNILPELIKLNFPTKNEILLTVHHTNIPAINLYIKAGFIDNGLRFEGDYGKELIFHFDLEESHKKRRKHDEQKTIN
jgi:ribosomal protein S18 acetylase RimI-like enzyme